MIRRPRALVFPGLGVRVVAAALIVASGCAGQQPAPTAALEPAPAADAGASPPLVQEFRPLETGRPAARPFAAPVEAAEPELSFWKDRTDLIKPPARPTPAALALPRIERWKLGNGLEVLAVPRATLPVVSFSVAVKAGGYDETRPRLGVAGFTAAMLRRGTAARSAEEISRAIEQVGGTLSTDGGEESSSVDCTALGKDAGLCLDLVADVLLRPSFPEERMGEVRDQLLGAIRQMYDDPALLAQAHFSNLVFGEEHPDGWILTPDDVARIGREDLLKFWDTYYRPNNSVLVVTGAFEPARMRREIERRFGAWRRADIPKRQVFSTPERNGVRTLLVDKDDLSQASLVFGHRGVRHADPRWYAATMVNYVLGGSDFSSRLMSEVRARRGLTYGIGSSFGASLFEGAFRVTAATRNETAWDALMAGVTEVRRMKAEGPTADELDRAKGFFAGSYPFRLQRVASLAQSLVNAELHDLGASYVRDLPLRLGAVDVARAKRAAADLLTPEAMVIVMVGRADVIAPKLEASGVKFERIHHQDPISFVERARLRRGAQVAVSTGASAKSLDLLRRGLEAQGGVERFRRIRDLKVVKSGVRKEGDVVADMFVTTYHRRPDAVRVEQEAVLPSGKSRTVVVIGPQGVKGGPAGAPLAPVPPGNARRLRAVAFEDVNFLLLNLLDANPPPAAQPAPPLESDGRIYDGVVVRVPHGEWMTLYFDRQTRLLARIVSRGEGGAQKTEVIDDYRDVGGLKFSFRQTAPPTSAGGASSTVTVSEIKVDGGLPAALFR